ncbi:hypothetical protein [Nocardioides litoris]|uniref:hypothetical protein n=1 Tax=Nocardioides litoris TaxID=1926648 RepID=UPI00147779EC|nr:hypothetical protein [Nocardioides litoris]
MTTPPRHLVLGDPQHGVARFGAHMAEACGADVVRSAEALATGEPVHLHLTDRLLARTSADAAAVVELLAQGHRLTVTLHDVPQPTDGPSFEARAAAYARIVAAAHAWAVCSHHERALVERWCSPGTPGEVLPLPVPDRAGPAETVPLHLEPVLGVFGFVYPGKGHRQVVRAAAALRRAGVPARVLAAGAPAAGHDDDVEDLRALAEVRGVPLEVTGRLPDDELVDVLRSVAVPVLAHRNVSASGSLTDWLSAGRRPLVRDGVYAREMAALRPGTATLFTDDRLADAALDALRRPASTWLARDVDLRPFLDDTVRGYLAWWTR